MPNCKIRMRLPTSLPQGAIQFVDTPVVWNEDRNTLHFHPPNPSLLITHLPDKEKLAKVHVKLTICDCDETDSSSRYSPEDFCFVFTKGRYLFLPLLLLKVYNFYYLEDILPVVLDYTNQLPSMATLQLSGHYPQMLFFQLLGFKDDDLQLFTLDKDGFLDFARFLRIGGQMYFTEHNPHHSSSSSSSLAPLPISYLRKGTIFL